MAKHLLPVSLTWSMQVNPLCNNNLRPSDLYYEPTYGYAKILSDNSSDTLEFDCKNDAAYCVGIDELHHIDGRRDETIRNDATEMREAFITSLGFNPDHVKLSISSNRYDDCTKEGLRQSFLQCANKVKQYGNFIFYFAGHGFNCKASRCLLVPADFNPEDEKSGISLDDIVDWLNISQCKARNVLFIFDCCYAGFLGEGLACHNNLKITANMFAMCGCAPKEKTKSVSALGHSVFAFFLLDYLHTSNRKKEFKVQQAINEVSDLCFKFSSLIMIYNEEEKLHYGTFNPKAYYGNAQIYERCVSNIVIHPKEIVRKLQGWREGELIEKPHEMVDHWFEFVVSHVLRGALANKASLSEKLQKAIVSASLHSAALVHYIHADDNGKSQLETGNLFLRIAIRASNTIDMFELRTDHMSTGLKFYIGAVNKLKFNCAKLQNLHETMIQ